MKRNVISVLGALLLFLALAPKAMAGEALAPPPGNPPPGQTDNPVLVPPYRKDDPNKADSITVECAPDNMIKVTYQPWDDVDRLVEVFKGNQHLQLVTAHTSLLIPNENGWHIRYWASQAPSGHAEYEIIKGDCDLEEEETTTTSKDSTTTTEDVTTTTEDTTTTTEQVTTTTQDQGTTTTVDQRITSTTGSPAPTDPPIQPPTTLGAIGYQTAAKSNNLATTGPFETSLLIGLGLLLVAGGFVATRAHKRA